MRLTIFSWATAEKIMSHENIIRLTFFVFLFISFLGLEYIRPKRQQDLPRGRRWPINIGLTVFNSLLVAIMPVGAIGMAMYCSQRDIGLLHLLPLPAWATITLGIICLDAVIYWQHRLFHRLPALWRLHILHHTDGNLDTTSALRFHPLEIVVSLVIKVATILILGISPVAVIIFEIILNGMAMFNHANLQLPATLDRLLRKLLVTPDMHRIHHSQRPHEMHSNFGFNLSIWDKLFGSYTDNAHTENFPLGIRHIVFEQQKDPVFLLALPFAPNNTVSGNARE
jgi:sterol desaturase/sphingolipid hydroxylase (fatty acid hydroxylase superfamily)